MTHKNIALVLTLLATASLLYTLNVDKTNKVSQFQEWKNKFGVKYDSMFEQAYRERVFLQNLESINLHNSQNDATYTKGINQFSAMTQEQFENTYLSTIVPIQTQVQTNQNNDYIVLTDVDWRSQQAVTPVKNQGSCGSCWAFSTTGALEGLSQIAYEALQSFSEQQLVDCSTKYGNYGCSGGLMDNAFKFVRDNGIVLQSEYPYKGVGGSCAQATGNFKISGFTDVTNCDTLATAIQGRPISVAVDATTWSTYKSGVYSNCSNRLNHGVLLVGVTDQYWIVKNSWDTTWGESGYIRLARGNTCGICNVASYPNK